jgi:hypothetical protein
MVYPRNYLSYLTLVTSSQASFARPTSRWPSRVFSFAVVWDVSREKQQQGQQD